MGLVENVIVYIDCAMLDLIVLLITPLSRYYGIHPALDNAVAGQPTHLSATSNF